MVPLGPDRVDLQRGSILAEVVPTAAGVGRMVRAGPEVVAATS